MFFSLASRLLHGWACQVDADDSVAAVDPHRIYPGEEEKKTLAVNGMGDPFKYALMVRMGLLALKYYTWASGERITLKGLGETMYRIGPATAMVSTTNAAKAINPLPYFRRISSPIYVLFSAPIYCPLGDGLIDGLNHTRNSKSTGQE